MNLKAIKFGGKVASGDPRPDVIHGGRNLRDVDDAREERYRGVECTARGWRPGSRRPRDAPAVHGLDGVAAPDVAFEQWVVREYESPLGREITMGIERDADVAGRCVERRHAGGNHAKEMRLVSSVVREDRQRESF